MLELEERLRRHAEGVIDSVEPVTADEARSRGVGRSRRGLWLMTAAAVVLAIVVLPFVLADDGDKDRGRLRVVDAEPASTTTTSTTAAKVTPEVPVLEEAVRKALVEDTRCTQPSCETMAGLISRGSAIDAAVRPLHEAYRQAVTYKNYATYTAVFRTAFQALQSCRLLSERQREGKASDADCVGAMRDYRRAVVDLRNFIAPS